jgi:hypothetical protein
VRRDVDEHGLGVHFRGSSGDVERMAVRGHGVCEWSGEGALIW